MIFQSSLFCAFVLALDSRGLRGSEVSAKIGRNFIKWWIHPENERNCFNVFGGSSFVMASHLHFYVDVDFIETSVLRVFFVRVDVGVWDYFCQFHCPTSASHCSLSWFVRVCTQNSPPEFLFMWMLVWLWNIVGRFKLMFAQYSCSSFIYRAASASTLSSVESSHCACGFTCRTRLVCFDVYWLGVVSCCFRGILRSGIFAVLYDV